MRDWTPLVAYGSNVTVPASSTAYVVLYPIPDFFGSDAEFVIADEEEQGLFLERVVGDILLSWGQAADAAVAWCLMPLGVDYESRVALLPYTSDWDANSSEWANEKFWDKRLFQLGTTINTPDVVDHPYWTQVDCHPRMLLGAKRNLWPCLVVQNFHPTQDLRLQHHLRGFWK